MALALCGLSIGLIGAQSAPDADERPEMDKKTIEFFTQWAGAYTGAKTMQFETLTTYPPAKPGQASKRIRVKYWLKRPNLLRAEVETSNPKEAAIMVSDGKIILEYAPNVNQYMKTPMIEGPFLIQGELAGLRYVTSSLFYHPNPIASLTYGMVKGTLQGTETVEGEKCEVVVRQFPQSMNMVWVGKEDFLPRFIINYTMKGDSPVEKMREIRRNYVLNADIPDQRFQLKIPKGAVQVISPGPETLLLKNGVQAPDFTSKDRDGNEVKLSSLHGRPIMLMFWAGWCPACQEELPMMETLQKEFADRDVVMLAVNVWDQPTAIQDYLDKHPDSQLTLWADPQREREESVAYKIYGVRGVPTTYLIGNNGKVIQSWIGYDGKKLDELRLALRRLEKKADNP